ncbi:MAG: FAD-dependent oxidoreductase [Bacillota bacterium]
MSNNIIILGAGYGGVAAAQTLHKKLKKHPDSTITLIDKNSYHTLLTELHEVAGNRIQEDALKVDLERIFSSTRVNIIQDEISNIDFENQTLNSEDHQYAYDHLIMGAGSKPSHNGIEGVEEYAFTLWSMDDSNNIKKHIEKCMQEARITDDPAKRQELLSFAVAGGGFTGVEMVGELIDWLDDYSKEYNIPRNEIEIYNFEGLDRILPSLSDELVEKAMKYMRDNGVKVKTGEFVKKIEKNKIILNDGSEFKTQTIIWTCGIEAADFAANSGLATDSANRIKVNKYLQTADYPNVYAIGDNAAAPWKDDQVLPALVESAQQTGECAAKNIIAEIKGGSKEELDPNLHGVMVSVGSSYAVAEVMGLSLTGIPAMFMKHSVNMFYRFEIGGIKETYSLISEYLKEQSSHKGVLPSLFGFVSERSRSLWLVLLRVFVGIMWLYEGYTKVRDGWLQSGDYLVSGASASPIGDYAVGWYVWLNEAIIFKFPLFFQIVVTLSMIGIGISLIFGLFATLGALGSAGFSVNFLLAGQYAHWSSDWPGHFSPLFWFLFASIALIGSGRSFGLDYYVLPWLKSKIWSRPKNKDQDLKKVVKK